MWPCQPLRLLLSVRFQRSLFPCAIFIPSPQLCILNVKLREDWTQKANPGPHGRQRYPPCLDAIAAGLLQRIIGPPCANGQTTLRVSHTCRTR